MAEYQPNGNGYSRLDRMEKLMQAFQSGLTSLLESQTRFAEAQTRFAESENQMVNQLGKLTEAVAGVVGILEDITSAQRYMQQEMKGLMDLVRQLREIQKLTDDRLNALIGVVEGIVKRPRVQ